MAHRTRRRLVKALARQRRELELNPPFVCPGCYAVGDEPCAPWCPDHQMEQEREDALLYGDHDSIYAPEDDSEVWDEIDEEFAELSDMLAELEAPNANES